MGITFMYRGYELRSPIYQPDRDGWAAYSGGFPAVPWFRAKNSALLMKEIDLALAEVPPPVV